MSKNRKTYFISLLILYIALFSVSCSFSVTPIYNKKEEPKKDEWQEVGNRDDLKEKALEATKLLHQFLEAGKFEDAYQMIDDKSPLKFPKEEAIKNLQEVVVELGKLQKMDITRGQVVQKAEMYEVRQEFLVKFEKDTPAPKRFEVLAWQVYPDNSIKLLRYLNAKGEDNE